MTKPAKDSRPRNGPETARRAGRPWVPRVVSLLVLLVGLIDVASALTEAQRARLKLLREYVPGGVVDASLAVTLATGLLLLLLAQGLRRRKRRGWVLTVVLLSVSVAGHLLKGLDVEEALVAFLVLVGLLALHGEFYAAGDPHTRWRAFGALFGLSLTSFVLGLALIALREDALAGPFQWSTASEHVLRGLVGLPGPIAWRATPFGRHAAEQVREALIGLGFLTGLLTVTFLLRPAEPVARLSEQDETTMRELLDKHGERDSLGYFALRRDKGVIWSPSRKACVAHRVVSGVMLASGDPLGDPEAWPGAIEAFLAEADRHAWIPAVIGCSERAGQAWTRAGLTALEIGDEAVVEVCDFTLEGRAMKNVRQATSRVQRAGYTCRISRVGDISTDEADDLRHQADAWRGAETERGFSMALGRFGSSVDPDCVAVMAFQDDRLRAFLHFVPWGRDGLSLDLMRRDRAADNGLNEFLISKAIEAAPDLGIRRLSLNFAVFRAALQRGEQLGAGPFLRAWRGALIFASRWWQIESLYRFNAKFRPIWEPRFLCFPSAKDLPRVAIAAMQAEAFLVLPSFGRGRRG